MDRQRLQHRLDVYRAVYGVCGGFDGTAANSVLCCHGVYRDLRIPSSLPPLACAGLASGTFYPLTLTFALRNIPLKFLPFTVALYATFVDGAVNIAPTLYGWYRDHLSWHWMFWNSAVITPLMMACIYFGIPDSPAPPKSAKAPSFAAFLEASAGFAMLYAAFDQGERLDWWRSGVFTAL